MRIEAVRGDLTVQEVDAVVNAANSSLLGGGGVDGALHQAAGPQLLEHCRAIRRDVLPAGLPTGEAVTTPGGRLPARHVIHTVGPVASEHPDGGATLLVNCHLNSLAEADRHGVRTIAFPAISCGVYGWRTVDAAPLAVAAVKQHASEHPECAVELVRFVLFSDAALADFEKAIASVE